MANRRPVDLRAGSAFRGCLSLPSGVTAALAGALIATGLTGCGIGTTSASTSPLTIPAIAGKAYGGPTPIVGATVKLYVTGVGGVSTGYGQATMVQEANQQGSSAGQDTDQYGNFKFAGGYNCPAGQFAYVVASGGNSGGNAVNNNSLLVAALGRCEDLYNSVGAGVYSGYKGGTIFMNELTTIAAAYALGHFATVTGGGTGSGAAVLIGAPATNNAAQVGGISTGCVAGVGTCAVTAAAGLAHAFQNAANLVNVFANSGTATGAYANLPGNSNAVVPQQLINTIGNILIACVNSTGGTANDPSACGQLFGATTIGANVPTNTFSAMVNLAANPTLGGSTANVASLFNLALPALSVYQPALTSTTGLNDYSIAINYPAALGFTFPQSGALDINDVYYIGNSGGSATAPVNVLSLSSNGSLLGASATNTNFKNAFSLSMDALGTGYFGNGSASGNNALGVFTTSGGVPSTPANLAITTSTLGNQTAGLLKVYATAVDRQNNLWVLGATNSGSFSYPMAMCPPGISTTSNNCVGEPGSSGTVSSTGVMLGIDPNQNVWTGLTQSVAVLENTGTALTPTYPTTIPAADTATVAPNPVIGIAFTGNAASPSVYVSGYKNSSTPGVQTMTYTQSGAGVASITAGTNQFGGTTSSSTTITGAYTDAADGAGTIWVASYNDHALFQTTPGATTPAAYKVQPCIGGATSCNAAFNATTGKPTTVAVDSTGSLWVTDPGAANVVQIIGSAAPTWPLLSLGKTGTP